MDGREHVLTLGFGEGTAGSLPEPDRFRVFEGQTASVWLLATLTPVGKSESWVLNRPAADWTTTDLNGKKHSLAGHRGKVIVLDFWYRGCGWCIKAMPQIMEVTEHFRDQPVVVLGMNTDRKEADARFVATSLKLNYATLKAAGLPEKYGVQAFPTLIIIDTDGIVRDRHVGYSPNLREELIETISGLLPQAPPP
ncbi:MAG: TlpA family protein disulfide reductase [Planctomycetes bacterium]|nr:TlpA family protein disulfide reductase [Planctomycetota bacterium]